MAGQSNMAGRSNVEPEDTVSNKRILSINKNLKDKGDHLDFVSEGQGTMGKRLANAYLSMY